MLTIQYGPDHVLEIAVDEEGIADLLRILGRLEPDDHEHLSTPSWGGHPLSEEFPFQGLVPIHQVTISHVGPEAVIGTG